MPMAALLLFLLSLLPGGAALAASITAIQPIEDGAVVRFDGPVSSARILGLTGPDRIAIDVVGAKAGDFTSRSAAGTIRQGQYDPHTARLVLDLDRNMTLKKASFAPDGRSIALWFRPVSGAELLRRLAALRFTLLPPAGTRGPDPYSVSVALPRPRAAEGLPKIYGPDDPTLPLIVVDAGHGGHDPGAISAHGGQYEKAVTLAIARRTRDRLVESGRFRVALTREDDRFLVLQDRYSVARRLNADLFISIHADSAGNEDAHGATVYTLSEVASDREARRLAARENKSDIINGVNLGGATDDVSSILIDLTQRETMNISSDFAQRLIEETQKSMPVRSDSHKFASFVVLKAPDTPSVLFETGYLSNAGDAARLTSAEGQGTVASAIANSVRSHFARRLALR